MQTDRRAAIAASDPPIAGWFSIPGYYRRKRGASFRRTTSDRHQCRTRDAELRERGQVARRDRNGKRNGLASGDNRRIEQIGVNGRVRENMSATAARSTDVIDAILGVKEGDAISALRQQKPELAEQLQAYYLAIFNPTPESAAAFPLVDRHLAAIRVAAHTGSRAVIAWHAERARERGASGDLIARAQDVGTPWTDQTPLGAAIRHADLVTTTPARTERADLETLKAAGYSPAGVLSLAQTIAFTAYQLRLIAGLRAFGAAS
jgi:uncharacterized protein YciW